MTTEIKYHTKEEAIAAVIQRGTELQFCSPSHQNDEDVVMMAIKKDSWNFRYASKALRSNKAFVMKALHDDIEPWYLIHHSTKSIQSDIEVMALAVEKSDDGLTLNHAQKEVALNKELAAKALVKYGTCFGPKELILWRDLPPTLKEFFPKDCWYEKAKAYLYQLEQEKQAELVSGGSTEEDEVVW